MLLSPLFSLFFPRLCAACGHSLIPAEKLLCIACISDLPRSGYWLIEQNIITELFKESVPIEHASAYLYYSKESPYHQLLHRLKYKGESHIGIELGRWFGEELRQSPFYQTVELIVPVPLHPKKERKRGYNQSLMFARGIAERSGWELKPDVLKRVKQTSTQTKLNRVERQQNVAGAFSLIHTEPFAGKHVLLVDDVLTTGATLHACAAELLRAPGCKISIATIAYIQ